MSEQYRTKEEYTERYAAQHNIVKEVCDELKEE